MMFRSQTDEQLAERWDDEPFTDGVRRSAIITPVVEANGWRYAPRVECIPSRDPEPWHEGDEWVPGPRHAQDDPPGPDDIAEFSPRPEYARPPVNRMLQEFRARDDRDVAWWLDLGTEGLRFTSAEIEHARKVLKRLAALANPLCDHGAGEPTGELDADGGTLARCAVCGTVSNVGIDA